MDGVYGLAIIGGSEVRDNLAVFYGGGVDNDNTLVLVDNSLVTGNQALNGGGLLMAENQEVAAPDSAEDDAYLGNVNNANGTVSFHRRT